MARLPQPGGDDGSWGNVLNDFLTVAHNTDGGIKAGAVSSAAIQDNSISGAKLQDNSVTNAKLDTSNSPGSGQVLSYDGTGLAWSNTGGGGDPTMGGDLSGLASNATIIASAVTTTKIADSNVTDAKIASGVSQSKITNLTTDLASKEPAITAATTGDYYRGDKTFQPLNQAAVGLSNVDNTSDANKPISTATQTALNGKASTATTISAGTGLSGGGDLSANRSLAVVYGTTAGTAAQGNDTRITGAEQTANKGAASGYASLNASTLVPTAQLGTGTANNTTFLRGDGTWQTVSGGGAAVTPTNGGGETYFDAGNSSTAATLDLVNGNVQKLTLTANCTITLTGPAAGAMRAMTLLVFQDATGSRTITWPGTVRWGLAGTPTLSTGAGKIDIVSLFTVDGGTNWFGALGAKGY